MYAKCFGVVLLSFLSMGARAAETPAGLVEASVCVVGATTTGSGVVFKNKEASFVWTAAHVLADLQDVQTVINPRTGLGKIEIHYRDVLLVQPVFQNGRQVGETHRLASILRFSDRRRGGEDLALLGVYQKGFGTRSVSFLGASVVPAPGEPLWHVGSMMGRVGANSLTEGVFSNAGRLEHNGTDNPKVFDQVTVPAIGGSSGGGVFLKKNGECIGLLTQGLGRGVETVNLVVPARRIRQFAERTRCEWAIDAKVPLPSETELREWPVTDRSLPVPAAAGLGRRLPFIGMVPLP